MKKILTCLIVIASANTANAYTRESKFYTHLDIGYGIQDLKQTITDSTNTYAGSPYTVGLKSNSRGYVGTIGMGYHLLNELRFDVSAYYNSGLKGKKSGNSGDVFIGSKSQVNAIGVFFSGYYDMMTGSVVNPYFMVGAGVLRSQYKPKISISSPINAASYGGGKTRTGFAYRFGAGGSYHFSSNLDIDFGYQLIHQGPLKSNKKNKRNTYEVDPKPGLSFVNKRELTHAFTAGFRYTF